MYEDTFYENEDVVEALRRLPKPVQDARMFRIQRALQLSNTKTILPKGEWTKYENVSVSHVALFFNEVILIMTLFHTKLISLDHFRHVLK